MKLANKTHKPGFSHSCAYHALASAMLMLTAHSHADTNTYLFEEKRADAAQNHDLMTSAAPANSQLPDGLLDTLADSTITSSNDTVATLASTTIVGNSKKSIMQNVGAAQRIDREALAAFDSTDPHEVLSRAPGVYVRSEDGYGLRPNIAIRGVRAERSQNVTIMEDGILITPAPYSAPAAYYFPNIARIHAVEVFKGPASIKYGPRTVGGALNLVSKPVSMTPKGEVGLSYGSHNQYKLEGFYTTGLTQTLGVAADAVVYGADGFKSIDGFSGQDTGFERKDVNVKLKWLPETTKSGIDQVLTFKLGYADEASKETYLGLSDADYAKDPYQRYAASQLDKLSTKHSQLHLLHTAYFPNDIALDTKLYHNRFEREWNKLDGFANTQSALFGGAKIFDALQAPDDNAVLMGLLRGDVNTSSLDIPYLNLGLDVTNNARSYQSSGIALSAFAPLTLGNTSHELEAGLRLHRDSIERNHGTRGYAMQDKHMVFNGFTGDKLINDAQSDAVSAYLLNTAILSTRTPNDLKIALGIRSEYVDSTLNTEVDNFNEVASSSPAQTSTNTEQAWLPGVGAYFQATPTLGVLAGIHKGFSPAGPGRAEQTADSETSINYELGTRYLSQDNQTAAEVVGFYSDYDNLIGRARASSGSNNVGTSYNGGAVDIYGLELSAQSHARLGGYQLPVELSYTYTHGEFASDFNSNFREWGQIQAGDALPYVPKHKARLQLGVESPKVGGRGWQLLTALNYTSSMREVAGSTKPPANLYIKDTALIDVSASYFMNEQLRLNLKLENALGSDHIASRRPFGARPVKPTTLSAAVGYKF